MSEDHLAKVVLYINPDHYHRKKERLERQLEWTINNRFDKGNLLAINTRVEKVHNYAGSVYNKKHTGIEEYENFFERKESEME